MPAGGESSAGAANTEVLIPSARSACCCSLSLAELFSSTGAELIKLKGKSLKSPP